MVFNLGKDGLFVLYNNNQIVFSYLLALEEIDQLYMELRKYFGDVW